jgi:formate dehydrogenase iron-sulfur subunit
MPKSIFIDTSRCTACRGCQLACKEWNELAPNATKQRGTHQNPPDLNVNNYKLVRFSEHMVDGAPAWYFFPDQCRHCIDAPCKAVADSFDEGAIYVDEATGAVVYTEKTAAIEGITDANELCPYNVPRRDVATGQWTKCTMCFDRISKGLVPACVKVCPTGTMKYGNRDEMLKLAEKRLAEIKKTNPGATLTNPNSTNVFFLLLDEPGKYYEFSVVQASEHLLDRKSFLAKLAKPLRTFVDLT